MLFASRFEFEWMLWIIWLQTTFSSGISLCVVQVIPSSRAEFTMAGSFFPRSTPWNLHTSSSSPQTVVSKWARKSACRYPVTIRSRGSPAGQSEQRYWPSSVSCPRQVRPLTLVFSVCLLKLPLTKTSCGKKRTWFWNLVWNWVGWFEWLGWLKLEQVNLLWTMTSRRRIVLSKIAFSTDLPLRGW